MWSWPTPPTTATRSAKPSPRRARSPSSRTIRRAPASTPSTSTSMPSATSSNAALASSSSSEGSQHASRRPPGIISPSSPSQPSSYGCDKCPQDLGDSALREFVGALSQFRSRADVEALRGSTHNKELAARISDLEIPKLVELGYSVRGIFVTNASLDENGRDFEKRTPQLTVLDDARINDRFVPSDRDTPETGDFEFDLSRFGYISFVTGQGINVAIAPIASSELVKLPGIESGALFEPNLRQSLGRTQVNREIAQSIETASEHGQFLLYHNGVTIVCEELKIDANTKKLLARNIFVVNGCQSISSLYDYKSKISDDLRVRLEKGSI